MLDVRLFGLICAAATLFTMYELIRRQNIKEKYTVFWALIAAVIAALAIDPSLLDLVAGRTGIKAGPSVLLLVGGMVVTVVCVQLSVEVSRLEDRSRALAEEIGLLRLELDQRRGDVDV